MKEKIIHNNIEQAIEWLNPDIEYKVDMPQKRGAWECINNLYSKKIKDKRKECHQWFDKLWTNREQRIKLYSRLAQELGLSETQCHFATMSDTQLDQSLLLLKKWWREKFDK